MIDYTLNPDYFKPDGRPDFIAMSRYLATVPGDYTLLVVGDSYKECYRLRTVLREEYMPKSIFFKGDIMFIYPEGQDSSSWRSIKDLNILGCVFPRKFVDAKPNNWPEFNYSQLTHRMAAAMTWLDISNPRHLWVYL